MHTLFIGLFICLLFQPFTTQFLTGPVSTVWNYTRRNLTCWEQIDTLSPNGTISYQRSTDYAVGFDYCFISIVTLLVNNLTKTTTSRSGIYLWNMYRNIAIHQCNFSTAMDIGYGSCTPYYYETALSIQLCICSTNNCSVTYASCQASVNQALSSPPPLLPVLQPTLSNTIICPDYDANYSATYNITPPMYLGCLSLTTLGGPDFSKCSTYTHNHTVMCLVYYDPVQGSSSQMALIEGDYELYMNAMIIQGALGGTNSSSGVYEYQTSTSIAIIGPSVGPYCLCTTNNCNIDFTTCTSGMNIPSYLLTYNGSGPANASTASTSTGVTTSSGLTTVSTASTSAGATTLSGSTTASTARTSTGAASTTLPSHSTSSSMSEKPFYSKLLVTIILMVYLSLFV